MFLMEGLENDSDSDGVRGAEQEITPAGTGGETSDSSAGSPVRPPLPAPTLKNKKRTPFLVQKKGLLKPKKLEFGSPQKRKRKDAEDAGRQLISKREKLLLLQEKRLANKEGTWAQCQNKECNKWRHLMDVQEPCSLPAKWQCDMNKDTEHNSCEKPEADYGDLEFFYVKHTVGCLVWAKISGYPWWPAMVDDDPDIREFFWTNGFSTTPTHYHVVFLDFNVTRAWISNSCLRSFTEHQKLQPESRTQRKDLKFKLAEATRRAQKALSLSIPERLKMCSFAHTFRGQWPKTPESSSGSDSNNECKLSPEVAVGERKISQAMTESEPQTKTAVKSATTKDSTEKFITDEKEKLKEYIKPKETTEPGLEATEMEVSSSDTEEVIEDSTTKAEHAMQTPTKPFKEVKNSSPVSEKEVAKEETDRPTPISKSKDLQKQKDNSVSIKEKIKKGSHEKITPSNVDAIIELVIKGINAHTITDESSSKSIVDMNVKKKKAKSKGENENPNRESVILKPKEANKSTVRKQKSKVDHGPKPTSTPFGDLSTKKGPPKLKPVFTVKKKSASEEAKPSILKEVKENRCNSSSTKTPAKPSILKEVKENSSNSSSLQSSHEIKFIPSSQLSNISTLTQDDPSDFEELSQLVLEKTSPTSSQLNRFLEMEE